MAGGDHNQDRYAYGDGWAFVLDGASSFGEAPPVHDGGWYAERLKEALTEGLANDSNGPISKIVAKAIRQASAAHDEFTQGVCPTSTIALARWDSCVLEFYVLGDSFAVWRDVEGCQEMSDLRLATVGSELREIYRNRLASGTGFDGEHRRILTRLQEVQARARNTSGGYWIAGADDRAAWNGCQKRLSLSCVPEFALVTDGLSIDTRREIFSKKSLGELMERQQVEESLDVNGCAYPRSKLHDDKTAVRIRVARNEQVGSGGCR
ncbi:protein phosphatase 2C domain-containing protein [Luteococcus sp. Sow4_B9]|uniref:protein phosphatase 2C domain-containing protein n=1 Tax=Luteococcus sp. Sow4_B9 TaxID=3438792 RepID=UPI003F996468